MRALAGCESITVVRAAEDVPAGCATELVSDAVSAYMDLKGTVDAAAEAVRFTALRVATLAVWTSGQLDGFAAAAEAHTSLVGLVLNGAALRTEAALRSYKFSRLSALDLSDCGLTPDSLPALADMLAGGTLTQLSVRGVRGGGAPFTGAHAAAFCLRSGPAARGSAPGTCGAGVARPQRRRPSQQSRAQHLSQGG